MREGLADYKCMCAPGFGGEKCNESLPSKILRFKIILRIL